MISGKMGMGIGFYHGMGGNGNGNGFMGMGGNGNRNSPSRTHLLQGSYKSLHNVVKQRVSSVVKLLLMNVIANFHETNFERMSETLLLRVAAIDWIET